RTASRHRVITTSSATELTLAPSDGAVTAPAQRAPADDRRASVVTTTSDGRQRQAAAARPLGGRPARRQRRATGHTGRIAPAHGWEGGTGALGGGRGGRFSPGSHFENWR